ncbi:MAG TPA: hypothetical protein VF648_12635 [Pyrinomonadaceae bacterium]|jgi:hypothetical protein
MNFNLKRAAIMPIAFFCFSTVNMAQETKPTPAQTPKPAAPAVQPAPAASPAPDPFANIPPAKPEDVASIDGIVKAIYEVISGDPGVKRDWNRFRSLFYPNARMIPTGKNPRTGKSGGRYITPEQYIEGSGPFLEKEGFHEIGIAQRVEQFGNIAHVFTTYQSKHKLTDEKPFMRGINSIQLVNDGTRWWVLNIAWSQETPESPIPEKYLKSAQ